MFTVSLPPAEFDSTISSPLHAAEILFCDVATDVRGAVIFAASVSKRKPVPAPCVTSIARPSASVTVRRSPAAATATVILALSVSPNAALTSVCMAAAMLVSVVAAPTVPSSVKRARMSMFAVSLSPTLIENFKAS